VASSSLLPENHTRAKRQPRCPSIPTPPRSQSPPVTKKRSVARSNLAFLHSTFYLLLVPLVVFLRAVNVGGANRCQPALIAKQLAKFGIVNVGAVGTFVVRKDVSESTLRAAIAKKLPFKSEIMICPARDILKLAAKKDPFARQPSGPDITRFVNVLARRLRAPPSLPLSLPSDDDWLLKIIAIENRFVLGVYRRQMKAITYLGKIEKLLGVPATTRNWNTIKKVVNLLSQGKNKIQTPL
jgi:uncharacterized protein (DUF1697 family)